MASGPRKCIKPIEDGKVESTEWVTAAPPARTILDVLRVARSGRAARKGMLAFQLGPANVG